MGENIIYVTPYGDAYDGEPDCLNDVEEYFATVPKMAVNVNEKVYHPLTKKFTTTLAN